MKKKQAEYMTNNQKVMKERERNDYEKGEYEKEIGRVHDE